MIDKNQDFQDVLFKTDGPCPELLPADGGGKSYHKTVLFLSDHGGAPTLKGWMQGRFGGHALWGCIELARRGYRVLLPSRSRFSDRAGLQPLSDWGQARRLIGQLGPNDICYAVHNVFSYAPIRRALTRRGPKVAMLLFAKEPVVCARGCDLFLAMTPTAADHARRLNPKAEVSMIGWGVELTDHHHRYLEPDPRHALCCGVTHRDHDTLLTAWDRIDHPLYICARGATLPTTNPNVTFETNSLTPEDLVDEGFRHAAYTIINLQEDNDNREACGAKALLESLALGRAVIKPRTGALDGLIDVEREGVGLYYTPSDPESLRQAATQLWTNPQQAAEMGKRGRALIEARFTMDQFADRLEAAFNQVTSD